MGRIVCLAVVAVLLCVFIDAPLAKPDVWQASAQLSSSGNMPIVIDDDVEFAAQAELNGWSGDGSEESPWIIEGCAVGGNITSDYVYIGNCTSHFVIQDCAVREAVPLSAYNSYPYNSFITIYNCESGVVRKVSVYNSTRNGVSVHFSRDIKVQNSSFSGLPATSGLAAVAIHQSDEVGVEGCSVTNFSRGVSISDSTEVSVCRSAISARNIGIAMELVAFCEISENNLSGSPNGMMLSYSTENEVHDNTLENDAGYISTARGIWSFFSDKNIFVNNSITGFNAGLEFTHSRLNLVYHNRFYHNKYQGTSDDVNYWDAGYPRGGNYWSDYENPQDIYNGENQNMPGRDGIADFPYLILVSAFDEDHYPLMTPPDYHEPESVLEPLGCYWFASKTVPLKAKATDEGDSGLSNVTLFFRRSTDNVTFTNWTWGGEDAKAPWEFNFTGGADGHYQFCTYARDNAYNVEATPLKPELRLAIDRTRPQPKITLPSHAWTNESITFSSTGTADNMCLAGQEWTVTFNDSSWSVGRANFERTFFEPGTYHVYLNATDAAGNWARATAILVVDEPVLPPARKADIRPALMVLASAAVIVSALGYMVYSIRKMNGK